MAKFNRTKRVLFVVLLLVGIAIIILLAFLPRLTKSYITKNSIELTGRKVSMDRIKINYLSSTLQILDFKYFEENGSDIFIGFDSLLVNIKPVQLLKHKIYVEQFLVVNPYVQIHQKDTSYNFSDLIEFYLPSTDSAESTADDSKPYTLDLNLLEIKSGSIVYSDIKRDHNISIEEFSFMIPRIYWGDQEKSKADINFKIGRGGNISSSFDYNTHDGNFFGDINLSDLELETVLPYLQEYMTFSDIDGTLSSRIQISGNQYIPESLMLKGELNVNKVILKDEEERHVAKLEMGKAVLKEFKPFLYEAEIDLIELVQPYAYFALFDSVSNFDKMLVETTESMEVEIEIGEDDEKKQLVLNRFVITNGLIDFSDQRLNEIFDYELSKLSLDMDTISLDDDWINLNVNMKLNKRGNLEAILGLDPMDPTKKLTVQYVISDFQLPDVNIYSKHYTGLPILFGDMYYVGNTSIIDRQLESKNELIIRNVEMGRKTGGLYDVPIKLALFILKDINGDIVLDIPVSGDMTDPSTDIGAIVWDTFKGFMFKIVASPFKALGNVLGASPKELEEIPFNYGDTTLLAKQKRSLNLLLELEQLKPEIGIEMHYLNDKKLERTDVASVLVQQSFFEKYTKRADANRKAYLSFLAESLGKDSLLIQDYERLLAPNEMVDSQIQKREELRIKLVRDYLSTENNASKIQVKGYNSNEVLNIGSRPQFIIKYVLAEELEGNE